MVNNFRICISKDIQQQFRLLVTWPFPYSNIFPNSRIALIYNYGSWMLSFNVVPFHSVFIKRKKKRQSTRGEKTSRCEIKLFQKRTVRNKLDIHVFINITYRYLCQWTISAVGITNPIDSTSALTFGDDIIYKIYLFSFTVPK